MLSKILKGIGVLVLIFIIFIFFSAKKMSHEVVTAFGIMNERLEQTSTQEHDSLKKVLQRQGMTHDELEDKTRVLINYIENLKSDILSTFKDPTDYATMDKSKVLDSIFFINDNITNRGNEFVSKIHNHKTYLSSLINNDTVLSEKIIKILNITSESESHWLEYNFKDFPAIASIAKLSSYQSDIKHLEVDVLKNLSLLKRPNK